MHFTMYKVMDIMAHSSEANTNKKTHMWDGAPAYFSMVQKQDFVCFIPPKTTSLLIL